MSSEIAKTLKPQNGLYTAFNSAVIKDAKKRLPTNVKCKTLHSIAYHYAKVNGGLIQDLTYETITEDLPYQLKYAIIDTITQFCTSPILLVSDFLDINKENIVKTHTLEPKQYFILIPIVRKYLKKLTNGDIPITFNFMLKWLYHDIVIKKAKIPTYDLLILDECQDTTAISLGIFEHLDAKRKIMLGDPFQSIYSFLNLVDGFELLTPTYICTLTKSFRSPIYLANLIETFCKKTLDPSFIFKGTEDKVKNDKTVYLTATNSGIVEFIVELHNNDTGYNIRRPLKEIFASSIALAMATSGKPVYNHQYKFLSHEYIKYQQNYTKSYNSFFKYLFTEIDDPEINNAIIMLQDFREKEISIFQVLKDAKKAKKDKNVTVGTVHSLKGMGFETVILHDNLNDILKPVLEKIRTYKSLTPKDREKLMVYYVACTRSTNHLLNASMLNAI